jgi:sarcosine oxidase subunit alpha
MVEVWNGLKARSQQRWPSLRFDVGAVNQLFAPFISAGFYYKTFMWPSSFWEKVYEPLIRKAAGLGNAPRLPDPDAYEKTSLHCDVLVIGSGPAGLASARAAALAGARVVVCEEDFSFGGRLLSERLQVDGKPSTTWVADVVAELAAMVNVTLLKRTTVVGCYDGGAFAAVERVADHLSAVPENTVRQRLWRLVAKRSVLASGAIERPLVFPNNDRPGIMLAGAVRSYVNRFGVLPGRKVVVVGTNDGVARTVRDLKAAGAEVVACLDLREGSQHALQPGTLRTAKVLSAMGGLAVSGLNVELQDGTERTFKCDLVAMTGGWDPALHLTSHLGAKPRWNSEMDMFLSESCPPNMAVAGSAAGFTSTAECLASGNRMGVSAAADCGFDRPCAPADSEHEGYGQLGAIASPRRASKSFVDFQNDVTAKDLDQAVAEGFGDGEHAKRYTTLGMATDQGKTSNVNGTMILESLQPERNGPVVTTFRPPYTPVSLGALAGRSVRKHSHHTRYTPAHEWAEEQGAVFIEAGDWTRAQYFPEPGEDWFAAMKREVRAVRSCVGMCDVSTLGKIHVQGPDAAELLEFVYTNKWRKLAVGRARYGLMLREDGFVFDDGTTSRLGENVFLMTTTTANVGAVMEHLEYLTQCVRPDMRVSFANVTEDWAQFSIAGPMSRRVLKKIVDPQFDISNDAFPYMAARELSVCDRVTARLFRISFSGELAYEIGVPADQGNALAKALMEAGKEFGIVPYGLEALGAMRLEKGHVGPAEMNGTTTARDLDLGKMASADKLFWGREMSLRPALVEADRPILVGLKSADGRSTFRGGAHLFATDAPKVFENDLGHVSSANFSPILEEWIGLGFLRSGKERIGQRVLAHDPIRGTDTELVVCSALFLDPEGERLRA